ncbi:MAG: N-6 DNA methylase [Cyanobacteria bacterium TGS_CYA1]|nr:N-6 DNA methylase [Cyanobacteria bacterium TGS_CYA1]
MPKRSWLSFVSKQKKQGVKLDDLLYALAIVYLQKRGFDWTGEDLHQFCLGLSGNNFSYGLMKPEPISVRVLNDDNSFELKKIGHTYECWRHLDRPQFQARIQTANKQIDADLLIGFTQIYTPDWVVRYLVDKSVLARDKTVIDPACGTGNFVLSAFDRLIDLGASVKDILNSQLCATDIDQTALSICTLSLCVRLIELGADIVQNQGQNLNLDKLELKGFRLISLDQTNELGSLYKDFSPEHPLSRTYQAVLTNPPYIGRRLISKKLKSALKTNFPNAYQDLSAAFLSRCLELTCINGRMGMITQASLLDLPAFDSLRREIIDQYNLVSIVDAGTNVFPLVSGDKVNSAILVIEKTTEVTDSRSFEFCKLPKVSVEIDKAGRLENGLFTRLDQKSLKVAYRLSEPVPSEILQLLSLPTLDSFASIKQGLATTDNARFVKRICDVPKDEIGIRWFPYVKGAGATRWYAPVTHVVDWQNNGERIKDTVRQKYPYLNGKANWVVKNEAYYFKPGICFSFVSSKGVSFRKLFAGAIFDVGASAIFLEDVSVDPDFLLAYLNSSLCVALLQYINPTINNQVGDVRRLPIIPIEHKDRVALAANANELIKLSQIKLECLPENRERILQSIEILEKDNDSIVLGAAKDNFNWTLDELNRVKTWCQFREVISSQASKI